MGILDLFRPKSQEKALSNNKPINLSLSNNTSWFQEVLSSEDYLKQYVGWTRRAVKIRANSVMSHPPKLFDGDTELTEDKNPFLKDVTRFNPYMSFNQARSLTEIHMALAGHAYWLIRQSDDKAHKYDFYILNPQRIKVSLNSMGMPDMYEYKQPNGTFVTFKYEDVVVFMDPDPEDYVRPSSDLNGIRSEHQLWQLTSSYLINAFGNSTRADGILSFENVTAPEAMTALRNEINAKFKGTKNAKKTLLTSFKASFIDLAGKSPVEMDVTELMEKMQKNILKMMGVPKDMVDPEGTTYANSSEAQRIFQTLTLQPILEMEVEVLNRQLLPKYYAGKEIPGKVKWKAANSVKNDIAIVTDAATKQYAAGVVTLNEARQVIGAVPLKTGGDDFYKAPVAPDPTKDTKKEFEEELIQLKSLIEAKGNDTNEVEVTRENLRDFFYTKQLSQEATFMDHMDKFFEKQAVRVTESLKSSKSKSFDFTVSKDSEVVITIAEFQEVFAKMADEYNKLANELTNADLPIDKIAEEILAKMLKTFSIQINDTTFNDITEIIKQSAADKLSLEETKAAILEKFKSYGFSAKDLETRAEAIARTETTGIKNYISRYNYGRNDNVEKMEWLTARDAYVRGYKKGDKFNHIDAEGQIASKGNKFRVSNEFLEYPGDKSGSSGNIINCRCTIVPIVK